MNKENYCTIEELIQRIKQRPGMYIHEMRLDYIFYLILGHSGCASRVNSEAEKDIYFKNKFLRWLKEWVKKNWDKNYIGNDVFWFQIIDRYTNTSEESVTKFIELAEQFFSEYEKDANIMTTNVGLPKILDWGNPKSEATYGTTFVDHGSHHKIPHLMTKAKTEGHQFGQWTDNQRAAEFIAEVVEKKGSGMHDVPLPSSALDKFPCVVYLDTGLKSNADMARIVVNSDGSVKVAYPFNSRQPH